MKHSLLTLQIQYMRTKPRGFLVVDSHAGIGLYDLQGDAAQRTGEAAMGITRLMQSPVIAGLEAYYALVEKHNADGGGRFYPGSPLLIRGMMRGQDRLIACELHPDDYADLRYRFYHDGQVQVHKRDGYGAMNAFLPPAEKRGLILIDPPYEKPDEMENLPRLLQGAYEKFPQGTFMIWYPVKDRPQIWKFHEALRETKIPEILCAEFLYEKEVRSDKLIGSGMIIINPAFGMKEKIETLFPLLHHALKTNHAGMDVRWLVG